MHRYYALRQSSPDYNMRAKPPSRVPSPPPTLPLRGPLGAIESPWLRIMASGVFPVARNCHRRGAQRAALTAARQHAQSASA